MDLAGAWRETRGGSSAPPAAGSQTQSPGPGITVEVTQQCQIALPQPNLTPDEVAVVVTSHRPGVAATVTIGANLNSLDGRYQGPTTTVGTGSFSATGTHVRTAFVVLPSGWPILGVGAEAVWADGAANSFFLNYYQLACDPLVWWRWPVELLTILGRLFGAGTAAS
ncbi:MAG: hypothetical protein ACR2FU_03790 [Streptosporangiaceae bacterium]